MLKINILENISLKKFQWYDLIKCECSYGQNNICIYLPASLLKEKNVLNDVDLGNEKYYHLDFNKFKKSGRNIDMLFDEYLENNQYPIYKEMFLFCRHLYRKPTYLRDSYGNPIDQPYEQFRKEFQLFIKKLNCQEFTNKKTFKNDYNYYIRDLLKIFILFKSAKITNIKYPLDVSRDYLPDEAKLIRLENILSLTKDTGSVAALYGRVGSRNEDYIKKLYALMLTNLDIPDYEFFLLFGYINYLEKVSYSLKYQYLDYLLKKFSSKIKQPIPASIFFKCIFQKLIKNIQRKGKRLLSYFLESKWKISLGEYIILKIYIDNRLKILNWNKIATKKSKTLHIIYKDKASLQKVYDITKKIPINNCDEMISALNKVHSSLTSKEQQIILDTIFPNDTRRKDKKRELLKNHLDEITIIYAYYVLKRGISGQLVDFNHFYNLIISAYLYFQLNKLNINEIKFTNCNKNNIDDRQKNIASLYYQLIKSMFTKKSSDVHHVDFVYLEVSNKIFSKYYFLFDLTITYDETSFDKIIEVINELLYDFWQEGLSVALRVAKV